MSMSTLCRSACSGAMYSGVPTTWPASVNSVASTSFWPIAFARPKSMILTCRRPPSSPTSTLLGLRSRCTTPFWCACCTAAQTCCTSRSRSASGSLFCSQYSLSGWPLTSSMTKNGCPRSLVPQS
ncbi:MAG TPA: hypothetical protein VFZ65_00390 [Planctomycetota bacterium]|nr:hypothetical protein [Planctomycetota bacterium]